MNKLLLKNPNVRSRPGLTQNLKNYFKIDDSLKRKYHSIMLLINMVSIRVDYEH